MTRSRCTGILFALTAFAGMSAMPARATDYVALSGKQLYETWCVSCHGAAGRGDGPVAKSLTREVPDLSLIARRHGGAFPRDLVERIIDGRHILAAHGTRTMPVWGEDLSRASIGDPNAERATRIVTGRLADYLWLLQRPAVSADAPVTSTDRGAADRNEANKTKTQDAKQ